MSAEERRRKPSSCSSNRRVGRLLLVAAPHSLCSARQFRTHWTISARVACAPVDISKTFCVTRGDIQLVGNRRLSMEMTHSFGIYCSLTYQGPSVPTLRMEQPETPFHLGPED